MTEVCGRRKDSSGAVWRRWTENKKRWVLGWRMVDSGDAGEFGRWVCLSSLEQRRKKKSKAETGEALRIN